MKIGLVLPYSLTYYGGVQNHVLGLYQELKKRQHTVKIFIPRVDVKEYYKNRDIVLIGGAINIPTETTFTLSFGLGLEGYSLEDYFKRQKFDILHFHNPTAPFLSWQILNASKTVNIATFHADLVDSKFYDGYSSVIKYFYDLLLPKIDGFIAVSKSAEDSLLSVYPKAKNMIIPNGIDIDRFADGKIIEKYKDGKFNLLYVGRFDERKGIFYLLEAFKKLKKRFAKKIRLILVGNGPQKWEIIKRIKKLKIKNNVCLVGEVKDCQLPNYYKTADLLVAPATSGESFGLVLLEAMAAGVPIVAAANRGYKEVLKEIRNCSLVSPRDSEALAQKIEKLIKNKEIRERLIDWGLNQVKKYSWKEIAQKVLDFYDKILKTKNDR